VAALAGNVDWVRLLGQLAAVVPPNQALSTFSGAATPPTASASAAASHSGSQASLGTLQMTVTGTGGQELPAQWLRALARIPSLTDVSVGGSATDGSTDTFSSEATVNPFGTSQRAATLPGVQP